MSTVDHTIASVHRVQIERVIKCSSTGAAAEFFKDGTWWCCSAWIRNGEPRLATRAAIMTPEQASTVAIALQMALDWIAKEIARGGESAADI